MTTKPNVIIFGETGAGKSSVINMLAGKDIARTASTAEGCTFHATCYAVTIAGQLMNIFDTAGLNEGDPNTMNKMNAIRQLYQLMISLKGGVNLLLFVMRAPRIKESYVQNWRLFHEVICDKQVPIGLVVTGLENETVMEDWWTKNRENFERCGMNPTGHACITGTRGKRKGDEYIFEAEYAESKIKVQQLIVRCGLLKAWNVPRVRWLMRTGILCWQMKVVDAEIVRRMGTFMSEEDAEELARELEDVEQNKTFRSY